MSGIPRPEVVTYFWGGEEHYFPPLDKVAYKIIIHDPDKFYELVRRGTGGYEDIHGLHPPSVFIDNRKAVG